MKEEVVMRGRRGSDAWKKRTQLAQDIKGLIDIILKHYDSEIYEGLGVVMRLDGQQIDLKHGEEYSWQPTNSRNEGGVLKIDYMKKIDVKKRSQQVKDESGMLLDLHDRII